MSINWFPGHMLAAILAAKKALAEHDVVIEVLDARCPGASSNPEITAMRDFRQRPALIVLNKADLADPATTVQWLAHFNAQPKRRAIAISAKKPADVAKLVPTAHKLAPHRTGIAKGLRLLIMGIPNVGKSTLINAMLKKRVAKVGDEPAVTKMVKRYDLGFDLTLTDTPGLTWPKIAHASDGLMLAASHAIGVKAYIDSEVAVFLADNLLRHYPQLLVLRYGAKSAGKNAIEVPVDGVALIELIAARRGYRGKGGEPDLEKAAVTLLLDYRSGLLGRISLESPRSRQGMLAQVVTHVPNDDDAH
jgi:ribosome biogenesis GTPase A